MSSRLRTLLFRAGSFALAAALLYFALRGVDLGAIGAALRTARYGWLAPLLALTLGSLALRAWRWQLLLDALPADGDAAGGAVGGATTHRATLRDAFTSVTIGYMVNYAAPRLGEVARAANLSARSGLALGSVFGTVVAERVIDLLSLGLVLVGAAAVFWGQLSTLEATVFAPARERLGALPLGTGLLVAVALIGALFAAYLVARRLGLPALGALWRERIGPLVASFRDGLRTLPRTGRPAAIVASTAGIWLCYWGMTFLPFVMLGMTGAYGLSFVDALAIMALGALGIVVPSPGGTGSYHYITIQGLALLFAVPEAPAATYAVLAHGASLVFYVAGGALCLLLQGTSLHGLRRTTRAAEDAQKAPPPPARERSEPAAPPSSSAAP